MFALILAGGKGERLMPLTTNIPKPMVSIAHRPILWYQVQWLKQAGVTDIVFLCGHKWEAIKEHFGTGIDLGVRVHYSVEDTPLGRGGAIKQGLSLVPPTERVVFATNGDIVTDEDPLALVEAHRTGGHAATLMLVPLVSPYGVVEVDRRDRVTAFREKVRLPHWINGGIYVLDREVEAGLPAKGDHEDTTFPALAAESRLGAFFSEAYWKAVDTFKDLREAEEAVRAGRVDPARWKVAV